MYRWLNEIFTGQQTLRVAKSDVIDIRAPDDLAPILVVDDSRINRMILLRLLDKRGFSILEAENGREAVDMYSQDVSMVLMDCLMPVIDVSYAATNLIKTSSRWQEQRTPIIALTANALDEDRDRCYQAGMDDFSDQACGA